MSVTARFKSDAFEAIHSSASAMLKVGTIDKATMRRFNETCLAVPVVAPCESMVRKFATGILH
ncbi:DNA-binding transcriptional regulator YiaG [Polymorphobacter multimanifer]|uniref:DNA-binding transcriptional regulator YiaG n=1 Tax=Polymorphobacter multimanifer TaxID=1070431 RepID=A0A841LJE0_9SPHN|nr:DNA-binding transcriptional regulator YiaG [Polymorphobacter multimanifer]